MDLDIRLDFLCGMMLGIEFPPVAEIDEDLRFAMVIDLLILRISFLGWKTEE